MNHPDQNQESIKSIAGMELWFEPEQVSRQEGCVEQGAPVVELPSHGRVEAVCPILESWQTIGQGRRFRSALLDKTTN
jgi:hypothetical protein